MANLNCIFLGQTFKARLNFKFQAQALSASLQSKPAVQTSQLKIKEIVEGKLIIFWIYSDKMFNQNQKTI